MDDFLKNFEERTLYSATPNKFLYSLGWSWVYLLFVWGLHFFFRNHMNLLFRIFLVTLIFYALLAIPVRMMKCKKIEYKVTNKAIYIVTPSVKDVNLVIPFQSVTFIDETSGYVEKLFGSGTIDIHYRDLNVVNGTLSDYKAQMKYIRHPEEVFRILMSNRVKL